VLTLGVHPLVERVQQVKVTQVALTVVSLQPHTVQEAVVERELLLQMLLQLIQQRVVSDYQIVLQDRLFFTQVVVLLVVTSHKLLLLVEMAVEVVVETPQQMELMVQPTLEAEEEVLVGVKLEAQVVQA
tara:strand:- start:17 stop:403 length:387 start_codon:yes stop_codon:yes gene_type:complete